MTIDEVKIFNERLDNVTIGIGRHFETLQGQIGERFDLLEKCYSEKFMEMNRMLNQHKTTHLNEK
jgi:hypothetical protein